LDAYVRVEQDAQRCDRRESRPSGPIRTAVYEDTEFDVMWDGR
jgi:hypothetical protein